MMNLKQYKNWIFSVFALVTLTAGTGYFYINDFTANKSEMIQLTDLSDADIDMIVAIKTEMYAASIESY